MSFFHGPVAVQDYKNQQQLLTQTMQQHQPVLSPSTAQQAPAPPSPINIETSKNDVSRT